MGVTKFGANKAISVVRNPIDVIPSFALLFNTTSHSLTSTVPLNELDPAYWERFVDNISLMMNQTCNVMQQQMHPAIPTYYVRYEDLVLRPIETLNELFCYLLEVPSIEGTVIEQRIREKSGMDATTYKMKAQP